MLLFVLKPWPYQAFIKTRPGIFDYLNLAQKDFIHKQSNSTAKYTQTMETAIFHMFSSFLSEMKLSVVTKQLTIPSANTDNQSINTIFK